jgi:hypothetical protein
VESIITVYGIFLDRSTLNILFEDRNKAKEMAESLNPTGTGKTTVVEFTLVKKNIEENAK